MSGRGGPVPMAIRARIARDPWAGSLGIRFLRIERGRARAALTLAPHMLNFQGTPHGGVIFSLADAAFSAACNAQGEPAVALAITISYLAPAGSGARLVADAREIRQGRRAGFYDVTVTAGDGRLVAVAHAVAHRLDVSRESAADGGPRPASRQPRAPKSRPGGTRRRMIRPRSH